MEPIEAAQFAVQFPVPADEFPVRRNKFPVPVWQGTYNNALETLHKLTRGSAKMAGNLRNSLLFSLFSGNSRGGAGLRRPTASPHPSGSRSSIRPPSPAVPTGA